MDTSVTIDVSRAQMSKISSDLDLRLSRVFLAVVDAGGFSAAEGVLNVRQPTISAQIGDLEARLGYRLCERGRKGFRLTPKGERFAELARRYLTTVAEFDREATNIDRELVGILNIGLLGNMPPAQADRLARAIARFRARDEAVQVNLSVNAPHVLEEQLEQGPLHIAVNYFWRRVPSLEYRPFGAERQVAFCGRRHPLFAAAGSCDPEDLAGHPWCWRQYPILSAPPLPPNARVTATADNMEATLILIRSGEHLGYLPEHVAAPDLAAGELAALNPAVLAYEAELHVGFHRRSRADPIVAALLKDIAEAA
jgi:DNA-binding transcriptional LysR family regulator